MMVTTMEERAVSLYEDATVWQEKHKIALPQRRSKTSTEGWVTLNLPEDFLSYEVWSSTNVEISRAKSAAPSFDIVTDFYGQSESVDSPVIAARAVVGDDGRAISVLGENKKYGNVYEVSKSNIVWRRTTVAREISIWFSVAPNSVEATLTIMCIYPPQSWQREYAFVVAKAPAFTLDQGYSVTFVEMSTVSSVDTWKMKVGLQEDIMILKRGRLHDNGSGAPMYQKRYSRGGAPETAMMMQSDDSPASKGTRSGVPAGQLFSSVTLEPGESVRQQRALARGMLPFARVFDRDLNDSAIVEILDVGEEELKGDLNGTFRVDPAPVTIVDENGNLMARGVEPSGRPEILQLSTVDGVRVSRSVIGTDKREQPLERISIQFNNERKIAVEIEVWEHNAARIEVKSNANIEISESGKIVNPDTVDGTLALPLRINAGVSTLVYELFHYSRK